MAIFDNETEPQARKEFRENCPNLMFNKKCFRFAKQGYTIACEVNTNCPQLQWYDENVLQEKKYYYGQRNL